MEVEQCLVIGSGNFFKNSCSPANEPGDVGINKNKYSAWEIEVAKSKYTSSVVYGWYMRTIYLWEFFAYFAKNKK